MVGRQSMQKYCSLTYSGVCPRDSYPALCPFGVLVQRGEAKNYTAVHVSHRHVQLGALESLHEFLDFGVRAIGGVYGLLTGVLLVHKSVCT
jgi:hypothetical protein